MMTMGRSVGRTVAFGCLGVACTVGAGCTLINSYDEVAPEKVASPDGSPGQGMDASMLGDASAGPDSGGNTGPDGGGARDVGTPDDGAAAIAAERGVIAIGGEVSGDAGRVLVLTAIDPSTGSELPRARMPMNVSAVFYDGVRDLWYVFESGGQGIFALPTDPFFLHTLTLDPVTGLWTEVGKFAVAPGVSFATTAVIKERLSYVAYGDGLIDGGVPSEGGAPYSLVTLDTSDPTAVTVVGVPVALSSGYGALVGTRSDVSVAGGFVTLGSTAKIDGGSVAVLTPVLVPGVDMPSVEVPIDGTSAAGTLTGFGAATINGTSEALVVTRPSGSGVPATLSVFDPSANDPTMALIGAGTFPFIDTNLKAPAFSACAQMAFVVGTNTDLAVHAVSIAGIGQATAGVYPTLPSASAATGHSGQGVYFEPYTNTVLTPFSQGENFALTAFTLAGTSAAPQLIQRQAPRWVPPPDLRPNFVATKSPYPDVCPTGGDN
jgi:hypothetical protein